MGILLSRFQKNTTFKISNLFVFLMKPIQCFFLLAFLKAVEYSLAGIFSICIAVEPGDPRKISSGIVQNCVEMTT